MPMFPLGTVLFPHATLPLHLFEDRYRALAETCLRGDGSEVMVRNEWGVECDDQGSPVMVRGVIQGLGGVAVVAAAQQSPDQEHSEDDPLPLTPSGHSPDSCSVCDVLPTSSSSRSSASCE